MKASSVRNDINRLGNELQTLRTELPNFERLFNENQVAEAKAKAAQRDGDETMAALSAACGRVVESRELLEQHKSDISTLEVQIAPLQERFVVLLGDG